MEKKKSGADLLDEDYEDVSFDSEQMETPFDQTVDIMATTGGPRLELFCRSNKGVVEAAEICYNLIYRFRSGYIKGRMDQIMRFTVSENGKGRQELVTALQAGSGVPDAFFESQASNKMGFTNNSE